MPDKLWLSPRMLDRLQVMWERLKLLWQEYESDRPEGAREYPEDELYGIVHDDVGCIDGSGDCDVASGTGLEVNGVTVGCTDVVVTFATLDSDGNWTELSTDQHIAKAVWLYGSTTPTNLCDCEPYLHADDPVPLKYIGGQLCVDMAFQEAGTCEYD